MIKILIKVISVGLPALVNIEAHGRSRTLQNQTYVRNLQTISDYRPAYLRLSPASTQEGQAPLLSYQYNIFKPLWSDRKEAELADCIFDSYRYCLEYAEKNHDFSMIWNSIAGFLDLKRDYKNSGWKLFDRRMEHLEAFLLWKLPPQYLKGVKAIPEMYGFKPGEMPISLGRHGLLLARSHRDCGAKWGQEFHAWQRKRIRQAESRAAFVGLKLSQFHSDNSHDILAETVEQGWGIAGRILGIVEGTARLVGGYLISAFAFYGLPGGNDTGKRWVDRLIMSLKDSKGSGAGIFGCAFNEGMLPPSLSEERVFTVYFSGTGSHSEHWKPRNSYPGGELIALLARHTVGILNIDWLQVDGIGSGKRDYQHRLSPPSYVFDWLAMFTGHGMSENCAHVTACLKCMEKEANDPALKAAKECMKRGYLSGIKAVNIVGWSRGGVSAIKLAAIMSKDPGLAHLPINMFVVDPVPGLLNPLSDDFDKFRVTSNVKNFFAVYAEDERSIGFSPIIPKIDDPKETKGTMLRFPGDHSTLVGSVQFKRGYHATKGDLSGSGLITRDLLEKFLTQHGTILRNVLGYNDFELLKLYESIALNRSEYRKAREHAYQRNTFCLQPAESRIVLHTDRGVSGGMEEVLPGVSGSLYINDHHKILLDKYSNQQDQEEYQEYLREGPWTDKETVPSSAREKEDSASAA